MSRLLDVKRYALDCLFTPGRRPQALFDLFFRFQRGHTLCNNNRRYSVRDVKELKEITINIVGGWPHGRANRNSVDVYGSHSEGWTDSFFQPGRVGFAQFGHVGPENALAAVGHVPQRVNGRGRRLRFFRLATIGLFG